MNVSLAECSSYKLWRRLIAVNDSDKYIPCGMAGILLKKYLANNSHFVSGRSTSSSNSVMSWKVMVKINLVDLLVTLVARGCQREGCIDEYRFHRLWLLVHLENMSVFFEELIKLVDSTAPLNDYLVSSQAMFSALSSVAIAQASAPAHVDFVHFLSHLYCATSPGFLHMDEAILLLQDLCRDWHAIHERIFKLCDPYGTGQVSSLDVLRAHCPTLVTDVKAFCDRPSEPVAKLDFMRFMAAEYSAFMCNDARIVPSV